MTQSLLLVYDPVLIDLLQTNMCGLEVSGDAGTVHGNLAHLALVTCQTCMGKQVCAV